MEKNWIDVLLAVLPAFITALIGIITIRTVNKKFKRYEISYSEIFKERIDVYRNILTKLFNVKLKTERFAMLDDKNLKNEIYLDINDLINYYLINQVYTSANLFSNLKKFSSELQMAYETFIKYNANLTRINPNPQDEISLTNEFFIEQNKFRKDGKLLIIMNEIIAEMRSDLHIDEL